MNAAELEPVAARGWPARETGALGGWRLFATDGFSGRINACWPLGAPGVSLNEAIDAVEAWYLLRRLSPRFKLADGAIQPPELSVRLEALGYRPVTPTLTMVGPLSGAADPDVTLLAAPDDAYRGVFADPAFGATDDAAERLAALERMPTPRAFALLRLDGVPAAIGAVVAEGDLAGVIGMRTAPAFRRAGLARRVFRALAGFAKDAGASRGYLQVEAVNTPAIALYRSEGFETAYAYRYWVRETPAPP